MTRTLNMFGKHCCLHIRLASRVALLSRGQTAACSRPSNKLDTLISSGTCIRLIVEPRSAQRVECASTLSLLRQTSLSGSHAAKFSMHRQPMRLPTTSPASRSLISTDSPSHRQPAVAHRRRPSSTRTTLRGCWERPSGVAFDCRLPCHGCCSFGNRERLVSVCGLNRGQP
jgi:hypothetical protein